MSNKSTNYWVTRSTLMNLYCIAGPFEFITMVCCLEGLPPFLVGGHRVDVKKFPDDD